MPTYPLGHRKRRRSPVTVSAGVATLNDGVELILAGFEGSEIVESVTYGSPLPSKNDETDDTEETQLWDRTETPLQSE